MHGVDPLRLTLLAGSLGMSGFALDDLLQSDFGVCAEMSTNKVPPLLLRAHYCCPLSPTVSMRSSKSGILLLPCRAIVLYSL